MSVTVSKPPDRSLKMRAILPWVGLGLVAGLLLANLLYFLVFPGRFMQAAPVEPPAQAAEAPPATATTVSLPEGKFKTARIATEPARVVAMPSEVGVAGRIDANYDRRVEIRPRAAGVIREVHALLGQMVKQGDLLAVLDSPDVGTARLNLRGRQRELATARTEAAWKNEVAENVARIIPELRNSLKAAASEADHSEHEPAAQHLAGTLREKGFDEKRYADRKLGSNRALLLQAYAELEIAVHEERKQTEFYQKKIVGEHPWFLAVHNRESAQAKFEAAREQVEYDAAQEQRIAAQKVQLAEAAVIDAAQRLRILGVSENIDELLAQAGKPTDPAHEDVVVYRITAAFDGTILTKAAIPSQKAEMNDVLFTLADLSTVWVMANLGESELALLPQLKEGKIRLTAAAYPGRTFEAKLLSVGSVVDPTTRTVPILAETPNPDGILKLGMFVRIVLDSAAVEDALTVPTAAVVEIDGKKGVFIPAGKDGRTFRFEPVKPGRESGERTIILSGISKGETVVSQGAFFLKSELILQNETEED
jgi:cobalt-zinc-cadmium efflux system membrane fusion protein